MRADVYYYPSGMGHVGVNIILSEEELFDHKRGYSVEVCARDHVPDNEGRVSTLDMDEAKLYARKQYRPVIFLDANGVYSIYGYKEGRWQETPLLDLSLEEYALLDCLNFGPVITRENGQYFENRFQNGSCQKTPGSKNYRDYRGWRGSEYQSLRPSNPLYKLIQKGHPEFRRSEYFFDFGGSYDLEQNTENRGEPICISLPPSSKPGGDAYNDIFKAGHAYTEKPEHFQYNIFNYNCAHASMEILHLAGYLPEKPDNRFGLLPFTMATNACDVAQQARGVFRNKLVESAASTDTQQLIDKLIEQSQNRLHDTIHFNYGDYIGGCSKDLENLSKITYDGSIESIERLLKASEEAEPHVANELNDCIALLNPNECMGVAITRLQEVAKSLKNIKNAAILQEIAGKLRDEFHFFNEHDISGEQFMQNTSVLLQQAEPILAEEQNISLVILKNIALAVCGLVVFYLVAAFINQANSGNFLFFREPSLLKVTENIQSNMPGLCGA